MTSYEEINQWINYLIEKMKSGRKGIQSEAREAYLRLIIDTIEIGFKVNEEKFTNKRRASFRNGMEKVKSDLERHFDFNCGISEVIDELYNSYRDLFKPEGKKPAHIKKMESDDIKIIIDHIVNQYPGIVYSSLDLSPESQTEEYIDNTKKQAGNKSLVSPSISRSQPLSDEMINQWIEKLIIDMKVRGIQSEAPEAYLQLIIDTIETGFQISKQSGSAENKRNNFYSAEKGRLKSHFNLQSNGKAIMYKLNTTYENVFDSEVLENADVEQIIGHIKKGKYPDITYSPPDPDIKNKLFSEKSLHQRRRRRRREDGGASSRKKTEMGITLPSRKVLPAAATGQQPLKGDASSSKRASVDESTPFMVPSAARPEDQYSEVDFNIDCLGEFGPNVASEPTVEPKSNVVSEPNVELELNIELEPTDLPPPSAAKPEENPQRHPEDEGTSSSKEHRGAADNSYMLHELLPPVINIGWTDSLYGGLIEAPEPKRRKIGR